MGIDVKQGLLDSQASSVKTMTTTQVSAYKKATEQLTSFTLDASLKGEAYENAKAYAQGPLSSLLTGAQLYTEKVAEVAQKIADKYSSEVSEDLNEDSLKDLIKNKESHKQLLLKQLTMNDGMDPESVSTRNSLNKGISDVDTALTELREKLTKLQNFSATSDSVRSELTTLGQALVTGYGQLSLDIKNFQYAKKFPIRDRQEWEQQIEDSQNQFRVEKDFEDVIIRLSSSQELELTGVDVAIILNYVETHPDVPIPKTLKSYLGIEDKDLDKLSELGLTQMEYASMLAYGKYQVRVENLLNSSSRSYNSSDVQELNRLIQLDSSPKGKGITGDIISSYNSEQRSRSENYVHNAPGKLVRIGTGLLGVDDLYTSITGKDLFSGEKASRTEAAAWSVVGIIPFGKFGKVAKVFKATDKVHDSMKAVDAIHDEMKVSDMVHDGTKAADKAHDISKVDDVLLEPLVNGPYIRNGKPYGRPTLTGKKKLEFEKSVYERQVGPDGTLRDPNTGEVINWKPGQPRKGVVDFGHTKGSSYQEMFKKYKNREISLEELKEFQFNPDNFRLETPSANRSHRFE